MKISDLIREMFSAGDLNPAMEWDETPADVKDSHTGEPSKLPITISDKYREDKKKKKRRVKKK